MKASDHSQVFPCNWVVCCDGTWNSAKTETNVFHFSQRVPSRPGQQECRYFSGLGTTFGQCLRGGLFGWGLGEAILEAYLWLAERYRHGDRIWLVGFSRGAYTVRALAGFLGRRGIPASVRDAMDTKQRQRAAQTEYERYREARQGECVPVFFLGVFDTVGKLGIPDQWRIANLFDRPDNYRFHDTQLGNHVAHARHAVAIDEERVLFMPTLWTDAASGQPVYHYADANRTIEQVWFSGVHGDVGGHTDSAVNDIPLRWMLEEARTLGLVLTDGALSTSTPSATTPLAKSAKWSLERAPRSIPALLPQNIPHRIHPTVLARQVATKDYHPTEQIASSRIEKTIHLSHPYVWTGIWLDGGVRYRIDARGAGVSSFVANAANPAADGTWNGHETLPLNHPHGVRPSVGGYLYLCRTPRAARGVRFWRKSLWPQTISLTISLMDNSSSPEPVPPERTSSVPPAAAPGSATVWTAIPSSRPTTAKSSSPTSSKSSAKTLQPTTPPAVKSPSASANPTVLARMGEKQA